MYVDALHLVTFPLVSKVTLLLFLFLLLEAQSQVEFLRTVARDFHLHLHLIKQIEFILNFFDGVKLLPVCGIPYGVYYLHTSIAK